MGVGSRIGPYEIVAPLGEGGMGVVLRARDARLERDVAIKVLPAAFSADPERLARFEREAKLLAQLHHPNIASIFGLEEADGVRALVLELVEGPTLAERIEAVGALPVEEALAIARQIAEALEEAHGKGIVHRDLKPQNVKLAPDGRVKVLDFGLAKAMDPTAAASGSGSMAQLAASPTLTLGATVQGVILGTAAYMSPEQAKGAPADKRADIWAFGVLLYELLTGARLFEAPSVPETLAQVLTRTPNLAELPPATPPALRRLLRRCLERNPRNRLHDVADARIVIDELISGRGEAEPAPPAAVPAPAAPARRLRLAVAVLAVAATALGIALVARSLEAPGARAAERVAVELSLRLGGQAAEGSGIAFAPDGSAVVFTSRTHRPEGELALRRLDRFEAEPLRGTAGATYPFWSPDSRSIGFFRNGDSTLCRYDVETGAVDVLARTQGAGRGASWTADGSILFAPSMNGSIRRLAPGGAVEEVTKLDPALPDGSHRFPVALPDGEHFLFTVWTNQLEAASRLGGIYLGRLDGGEPRRLTSDLSQAVLVGGDRLLVRRDEALVALPFDARKLTVGAGGERVAERPLFALSSGTLTASGSARGDLAYALASSDHGAQISWLDRDGRPGGTVGNERLGVQDLALAPIGDSFVAQVAGSTGGNLWVGDARREVLARLTAEGVDTYRPVWSPDARRLAYSNETTGSESVYLHDADGSRDAELLLSEPDRRFQPTDWSADGRWLFLETWQTTQRRRELWVYDFESRAARSLLADRVADLGDARLSPDGRWLAYTSDESGNPEVFVRPFPALDRKWKVSQGGALEPHWRRDNRELLFSALGDRSVMVVPVEPRPDGLSVGIPEALFTPPTPPLAISPDPDHRRFLVALLPGDARPEPIRLLLGWRANGR